MTCVQNGLTWQSAAVRLVTAAIFLYAVAEPAIADHSHSDLFQPDVFRTNSALHQRTQELMDPLGRDCELPAGALSLPSAADLALCRNPATRTAWANARQQAAALGSAQSAWLPNLTATGAEERSFGAHADVTGAIVSTPQNTRDAALNLSWTLYDFGARDGHITSARHLLDAAAATADNVAQQTVLLVVQNYYGVVAADGGLDAAKSNEGAATHSFEVAHALQQGGAGTRADVLQAQTAYENAVLTRVQAEQSYKTSRGTLAVTLGLDADQPLTLAPEPVPTDVPPLTARMSDLMAEAMRQRPDLAAAQSQRDSAVAQVTVARAAGRPTISVSASRSLADTPGVPNQNNSLIGINVSVPVFSGFSTAYAVRQAQALLESSEVNVEQVRLNVSVAVWTAYYTLDSANRQLTVTADLIKTAEENEQVALGRYQSGVGSIVDVLTAQSAAATARQTRVTAELNWRVARAQLALALGRLSASQPLADVTASP